MKREYLFEVLGDMNPVYVKEAAQETKATKTSSKKLIWAGRCAVAAFLSLAAASVVFWLHRDSDTFILSDASYGVTVQYMDHDHFTTDTDPLTSPIEEYNSFGSYLLANVTEEEIFARQNTAAFQGTVTEIRNIVLDFNGLKKFYALARIRILETYRGPYRENDVVTMLLPCPIGELSYWEEDIGMVSVGWVEDTEVISRLRTGMTGIFMPTIHDENSFWRVNGACLALKDIAECGLGDGVRHTFLETEDGLIYARGTYKSLAGAETLEDVAAYVIRMIQKTEGGE